MMLTTRRLRWFLCLALALVVSAGVYLGLGRAISGTVARTGDKVVGQRTVFVETTLPPAPEKMQMLRLGRENWTVQTLQSAFWDEGQFTLEDLPPRVKANNPDKISLSTPQGASLVFWKSRQRLSFVSAAGRSFDGSKPSSLTVDQGLQTAEEFIRRHGGLPDDAELWYVLSPSSIRLDLSGNGRDVTQTASSYKYIFGHRYNGVPVIGDRIHVKVSDEGVLTYIRVWRTIEGTAGETDVMTAREALRYLSNSRKTGFKIRPVDSLTIAKATLVFAHGTRAPRDELAVPCWKFDLPSRGSGIPNSVLVDARNGEVLVPDAD